MLRRELEGAPGGGEHAGGGPLRPLRRPQELGAEGEQQGQTGKAVIMDVTVAVSPLTLLNCHQMPKYSALFNLKASILKGYMFSHKSHWFIS